MERCCLSALHLLCSTLHWVTANMDYSETSDTVLPERFNDFNPPQCTRLSAVRRPLTSAAHFTPQSLFAWQMSHFIWVNTVLWRGTPFHLLYWCCTFFFFVFFLAESEVKSLSIDFKDKFFLQEFWGFWEMKKDSLSFKETFFCPNKDVDIYTMMNLFNMTNTWRHWRALCFLTVGGGGFFFLNLGYTENGLLISIDY